MSRRRAIKPAYVWGSLNNTEPPDDDDMSPIEAADNDNFDWPDWDDGRAASEAEDRNTAWRDATASQ